jgi:hypothetical protein
VAIQIALVALVATQPTARGRESLAGAILELVAALAVVILVDLEHVRSIRPSFLVSAYLFTTLLLDLVRVRTAWLLSGSRAYSACLSTSLAIKLLLLILENVEKRNWLLPSEKVRSGESVSGPFSRGLFTWLNGLLWKGYSVLLTSDTLPTIHEKLSSHDLSAQFADSWARSNQSRQNALLLAVINCLRWEMVGIAFPRLCVVGFSIAQPFLVGKVVTVLEQNNSFSLDMGYGLIGATAIVFIGVAVSYIFLDAHFQFHSVCEPCTNFYYQGVYSLLSAFGVSRYDDAPWWSYVYCLPAHDGSTIRQHRRVQCYVSHGH